MESIHNFCRHNGNNNTVRDKRRRKKDMFPYYLPISFEETWKHQLEICETLIIITTKFFYMTEL
jgi:hypothetical protein